MKRQRHLRARRRSPFSLPLLSSLFNIPNFPRNFTHFTTPNNPRDSNFTPIRSLNDRCIEVDRSLTQARTNRRRRLSFSPSLSLSLFLLNECRSPIRTVRYRGFGDRGGTPRTPRFSLQNEKSKRGRLGHASRDAPGKLPAKRSRGSLASRTSLCDCMVNRRHAGDVPEVCDELFPTRRDTGWERAGGKLRRYRHLL